MTAVPGRDEILAAAQAIHGRAVRTPTVRSAALDRLADAPVFAKAECLQVTGSFKVRGALNRITNFTAEERQHGLITVSAGNAALGAAFAAREFGCQLTVIMPANVVPEKLEAVTDLGATAICQGVTNAKDAFEKADRLIAEQGLMFVHPFDDPFVVAGAATATMELFQDAPELRRLFVPCSGGGLLAGAIAAATAFDRDVEVIGVQPEGADGFVQSLASGQPTAPTRIETIADGLTAPKPGRLNYDIVAASGARVRTVDDEQIIRAMRTAVHLLRLIVEPAGATALAGLVAAEPDNRPTGVLLSGSNVNWQLLASSLT